MMSEGDCRNGGWIYFEDVCDIQSRASVTSNDSGLKTQTLKTQLQRSEAAAQQQQRSSSVK